MEVFRSSMSSVNPSDTSFKILVSPSFNENADILILLQPTTPFRTSKIIDKAIRLLIKNKKSDALMTITDADYPPYWMFKKRKTRLFPILKGHKFSRRQDAPKVFKPAV